VLSSFSEDERVFPAIKSGAFGYLLKDTPTDTLLQAIRDVYHGESAIHPTIARILIKLIHQPGENLPAEETFSEQEVDVLRYIARGFTNREIAEQMRIEEREVRADTSLILEKLHRANRKQAAINSSQNGGEVDLSGNGSAT
jgi:NarL family two-component system response regulator LiaR